MFITDIRRVIEQVSRDKGIESDILIRAIEEALKSAARKKFGNKIDIEVKYNEELGEIEVFQFREVVVEISEPVEDYKMLQITLDEGLRLDPECEIGDSLGTKMDTSTFGRIAAQSAKQVIIQKMKDAEREAVYSGYIDRKGEIINGIVQRIDRGSIIVNLGQTEAVLPEREQVPRETYRRGDRIRAYIMDVRQDTRGPQVILSRTHPNFLISLFKTEVPEISESIVTIMGAAREPGVRAKFAVSSNDSDIDPVGACVGMKGSRVQNVVQELRGEKIDIISWHVDPAKFVCNALAPAEISRVIIDEENRSMEVIVPDEFLSVAIGKGGQNVRLASKLTRWRLDVKSEAQYSEAMEDAYNSLMALPEMTISLADALYERGFFSAEELSKSSVEDLIQVRDITEEKALELIQIAKKYVENPDGEILHVSSDINQRQASLHETSGDDSKAVLSETPMNTEATGQEEALSDTLMNTETPGQEEALLPDTLMNTETPEQEEALSDTLMNTETHGQEEALSSDNPTDTEMSEDASANNLTDSDNLADTEMPEYASANDPTDNSDLAESDGSSVPDVQKQVENDNEKDTL